MCNDVTLAMHAEETTYVDVIQQYFAWTVVYFIAMKTVKLVSFIPKFASTYTGWNAWRFVHDFRTYLKLFNHNFFASTQNKP